MNSIKCIRCTVNLPEEHFERKRCGNFYKQCNRCRKYTRERVRKNKCEHGRNKNRCKDCGTGRCEHGRYKSKCKDCGAGYCEHGRDKSYCKDCGTGYCEHGKGKRKCKDCDLISYTSCMVGNTVRKALKCEKSKRSVEYLGCSIDEFKEHIEKKFQEGMTWDNHGEWHIDHFIPLKYENPTIEEVIERLHYTNTQPLWASENMSKGNRFIG